MMTALRNKQRIQRTAKFNLEYLDDRIVPSAIGAEAHVAAVSTVHVRAEEKAVLAHERHEAKLARLEARHEAKLARLAAKDSTAATPLYSLPFNGNHPVMNPTTQGGHGNPATASPASLVSPTTTIPTTTTINPTTAVSTDSNPSSSTSTSTNSTSPLPTNASAQLQSLYSQYESFATSGGTGTFSPTGVNGLVINGTDVGINVHTNDPSDFGTVLAQLQSAGLQVSEDSASYGLIEGMVPIAQLPAIAQISSGLSVTAMFQQMPG